MKATIESLREFLLQSINLCKENQASGMFWSGHIEGKISAYEDVLREIDKK